MAKVRSKQEQPLRSAQRLLDALSSFTLEKPRRTLTEISDELELAPSTVRRLLLALEGHGLLILDRDTNRYGVSPEINRLATVASIGRLGELAAPFLDRLRDETTETVILAARDDDHSVHVDVRKSTQLIAAYNPPGTRFPVLSGYAIGQVLAAWLPEAQLGQLTPEPADATVDAVLEELPRVRRRGYAVNDRLTDPDAWSVAVPVWSTGGTVDAALCVVAPSTRAKRRRQTELIAALKAIGDEVCQTWQASDRA